MAVKIKRRNTGARGAPASLASGQLAWNGVDKQLFIGDGDDGSGAATSVRGLLPVTMTADGGATDNAPTLAAIKSANPQGVVVRLEHQSAGTYFFNSLPDFTGVTLDPQTPDVSIACAAWFGNDLRIASAMKAQYYSANLTPYYQYLDPGAYPTSAEMRSSLSPSDYDRTVRESLDASTDLEYVKRDWGTSADIVVTETPTARPADIHWVVPADARFHYARTKAAPRPGDELACYFPTASGAYLRAAVVECSDCVWIFTEDSSRYAALYYKALGVAPNTASPIIWTGLGNHDTYSSLRGEVSIRLLTQTSFTICISGTAIMAPIATTSPIEKWGFGGFVTTGTVSFQAAGWTLRRMGTLGNPQGFVLGVLGDSKSSPRYGDWTTYFRQEIEFHRGIRLHDIDNRAVAGETSGQQLARLKSVGLGSATFWVVAVTTNDIQGQLPLGTMGVSITSGTASMTAGTNVLNVSDGSFTNALPIGSYVGAPIFIPGAGASGGVLTTTIASVVSPTQVTTVANAQTTITNKALSAGTQIVVSNGSVIDNVYQTLSFIQAGGCRVVFAMPMLWYTQAQAVAAGGRPAGFGQASSNYEMGAKYYSAIERLCNYMNVPIWDGREPFGQVIAQYLTFDNSVVSPVVMDNIHQDGRANQVMGRGLARLAASIITPPADAAISRRAVPGVYWANGWTPQAGGNAVTYARSAAGVVSLAGIATAGTLTAGTVLYTLPTYLRPAAALELAALTSAGTVVRVQIATNGQVSIPNGAAGATWISLAASWSID